MSSKYFPGLPPYVDPGLEARRIPEDVRGGLRSAWPVRRVEDQLAALATIEAIPGDQRASLQDAFGHAVALIDGQVVMLAGQIEAATLLAAAYGLDDGRLREVEAALRGAGDDESDAGSGSPGSLASSSLRDLYIAKAKDLEAKLDEATKAREAAESRALMAENAISKARADIAVLSNQVANQRSTIASREAEAARVKAGLEKALAEAKDQLAAASKPKDAGGAAEPEDHVEPPPAIILPPGVDASKEKADEPQAPEAPLVAEVIIEAPPVAESPPPEAEDESEVETVPEADAGLAPAPSADASKPAKNGRKAR